MISERELKNMRIAASPEVQRLINDLEHLRALNQSAIKERELLVEEVERLRRLLKHAGDNWAEPFVCLGDTKVNEDCKVCDEIYPIVEGPISD